MTVRAVFFDTDGTLVDSNEYHVEAWRQAFAAWDHSVSKDRIRKQIGKAADLLIPALIPGIARRQKAAITTSHAQIFESVYLSRVQAFPSASELLRAMHRRGVKVLLASSAKRAELDHYVELLGVQSILGGRISADEVDRFTPAADIFAAALGKVAPIPPPEVLVVGDTPYDVLSAARCRIGSVALRSGGFADPELYGAGAKAVYDNVGELLSKLDDSPLAHQ